ncbi:MAG: ATP-binding cassette domain-containing protein [Flavobacterium sp.]|nr:ATP-binding cassette domain-containing protein [Flavobacterium sp.]
MQIQLTNTGKRYNRDWIFRQCTYTFNVGNSYAIIGPNGSGKSTLLQTIAGAINPSEGSIAYSVDDRPLTVDNFYKHIALAAPYLEVIEEMTATEFLQFHAAFKPLLPNITIAEIIAIIGLEKNANKQIRYYSSGMKQRIKLAQAIFADTNVLLLDEPCTNLDVTGYKLYNQLISTYCAHKLIIVSSNYLQEYGFCKAQILISDYK